MQYLVDGHNLIPRAGLRLDAFDDENEMIKLLQVFCRLRRSRAEVYFDNAPPGFPSRRVYGAVTAVFVRRPAIADAAIENRLMKLGQAARNWTVVSSDERVLRAAAAAHAMKMPGDEFMLEMSRLQQKEAENKKEKATPSSGEVEEWLEVFQNKRK